MKEKVGTKRCAISYLFGENPAIIYFLFKEEVYNGKP